MTCKAECKRESTEILFDYKSIELNMALYDQDDVDDLIKRLLQLKPMMPGKQPAPPPN